MNKKEIFVDVEDFDKFGLRQVLRNFANEVNWEIVEEDFDRPWGGYLKFDEKMSGDFLELFFPDIDTSEISGIRMCPKFLIVEKGARLSWQYHNRRSEEWVVLGGKAGVVLSDDNTEGEMMVFEPEDRISIKTGIRHRLVGMSNLLLVAEVWINTHEELSGEDDIVRIQDDYSRVRK